ncbi:methyltransferase domain-containing protein [Rhizobium sp. RU36D]|uniref:class I SAM-dependent methyltransferase n=1 Tax=Rhizobium sp. RU36D TaxID=1907415 RepID=UPI0009D845D4|nr:methyltransferase domain-containing protein [Rhizobium sp. RU36D]SMC58404.1 Predicted nicotinamide N-methyase [Rhizobium sp. RU36D]
MRLADARPSDADEDARRRTIIRDRLTLQAVPGLGGSAGEDLLLYAATPTSRLSAVVGDVAPYWAHSWAGGLTLARYLADHPHAVAGLDVLDLGTGNGLVALAAARAGAREVTGCDCDPWAIAAARLNAEANGIAVSFLQGDVTAMPLPPADVVLVGDLFYDTRLAQRILVLIDALVKTGTLVLVGDPGRRTFPLAHFHRIAAYTVSDFGSAAVNAGVYGVLQAPQPMGAQ